MTVTATVRITHPDLPLSPTLRGEPGLRVERAYDLGGGDERYGFYSVDADDAEAFEAALGDDPTVADWLRTAAFDDRVRYRIELTDETLGLGTALASMGIAIVEAAGATDGWRYVLQLPDRDRLAAFNDYCAAADVDAEVEQLSQPSARPDGPVRPPVTDAQREALVTAYERGFFDEPRGTSLEELATELDVSATAVGGRLRRGTAALIDAAFPTDDAAD